MSSTDVETAFRRVRARFDARDAKLGTRSFSDNDWDRTKLAFEMFSNARTITDIGIGQGQLVNLFCELTTVDRVVGIDRTTHTKFLGPQSPKFRFFRQDITQPPGEDLLGSDITIAMEVFEHIDIDKLSAAIAGTRRMCRHGLLFASVPYREKHPLYHHDKPHGHKQSFDDDKVAEVFGPDAIWTSFRNRWYLVFVADDSTDPRGLPMDAFVDRVRNTFAERIAGR